MSARAGIMAERSLPGESERVGAPGERAGSVSSDWILYFVRRHSSCSQQGLYFSLRLMVFDL